MFYFDLGTLQKWRYCKRGRIQNKTESIILRFTSQHETKQ